MIDNIKDFERAETRRLLNKYKMPINWLGYKYLITAVPIAIEKISLDEKIVFHKLYKRVAERHKTTPSKVEYAIRYLHENTDIAKRMNCEKVTNQTLIVNLATTLIDNYNL